MWQWSVSDVTEWLRAIGPAYSAYAAAFADNALTGSAVMDLTFEDLTGELKVAKLHAKRLFGDIQTAVIEKAEGDAHGIGSAAAAAAIPAAVKAAVAPAAALVAVDAKEQAQCVVCLSAGKAVCFVPCGHVCCCTACSESVEACPLCRAAITTRQRVVS